MGVRVCVQEICTNKTLLNRFYIFTVACRRREKVRRKLCVVERVETQGRPVMDKIRSDYLLVENVSRKELDQMISSFHEIQ